MRILIIDDDYVSRIKLKALLASYGDCDAIPSGEIALQMYDCAVGENVPYEIVATDIDMPGMRGPEVVKEILSRPGSNNIKILMITGKSNLSEVASSFREGCDLCIKKPVTSEKIKKALWDIS